MRSSQPRGSLLRRIVRRTLRITGLLLCILVAAFVLRALYAFRDRHPGYKVALNIDSHSVPAAELASLRAGFARVKINPVLSENRPVWMAGFSQHRAATKIHDDLWAIACVFDDGRTRVGVVTLDAIGFFHDEVIEVRKQVHPSTKIDYIVICSTHNHSTPDLLGLWGPDYAHTGVDKTYRANVIAASAKVLERAVAALQPARLAFHEIPTPHEGLATDTREPEVFDPDIRVMHFTSPTNNVTLGSIVGWANHPETVWSRNTEITADFPGYLRETLENGVHERDLMLRQGIGGTHLFINGAIGGLISTTPKVTVRDPFLKQDYTEPSHDKARALGRALAARILPKLEATNATSLDRVPISVQARTIELPLDNKGFLLAPILGVIDRGHVKWKTIRSELALLTIGEASVACIPGEIYPEIVNGGIETPDGADFPAKIIEVPPIREMMPGKFKFVFGLANDEIGYIIPKSEFDRKAPYLYGAKKAPYGEINSVGPDVAGIIHEAFRELTGKTNRLIIEPPRFGVQSSLK